MRIVLASTSPRRRELLGLLGISFEVCNPVFDEHVIPGRTAEELAAHFASGKAHSVAGHHPEAVILGSDTLIDLSGEVLGKPADLADARSMLRRMAGRDHLVHTAVTLFWPARLIETTQLSTARVRMKDYVAEEHERYLVTGDSIGKAGAYSIQGPGAELVERIEGDFLTVVGFPLRIVAKLLTQVGIIVPVDVETLYAARPYGNWSRFSS